MKLENMDSFIPQRQAEWFEAELPSLSAIRARFTVAYRLLWL